MTEHNDRLTIREWMTLHNVGPKQLAEISGLHLSTVYEVVEGRRLPTYGTLAAIMAATNGAVQFWDAAFFLANRRRPPYRTLISAKVKVPPSNGE